MEKEKYFISEAAEKVDVESHVLRYWEEELDIPVCRNKQGHRFYTKEDIQLFCCIKKLKDEGVALKDLKPLIPEFIKAREQIVKRNSVKAAKEKDPGEKDKITKMPESNSDKAEEIKTVAALVKSSSEKGEVITDKQLNQVRSLIGAVLKETVEETVAANNTLLVNNLRQAVTYDIMKEMNLLIRTNERRTEEHFRKLDQTIRQQQTLRKEAARGTASSRFKNIFT